MKKVVLAVFFLAALCSAKAQEKEVKKNALKINPLSLLVATANVSYERAAAEKQTFQLGMFYTGVRIVGTRYSGIGITPEYRFYVGGHKQAMNGVYLAPFLRYQHLKWEDTNTKDKFTYSSMGGGALVGYEYTMDDPFILDLFIGPSLNSGTAKSTTPNASEDASVAGAFSGFTIRLGLSFGFRF